MTAHLGKLQILDSMSVVEARRKIHALARSLRFDDSTAIKLASTVSELGRRMQAHGEPLPIEVRLDSVKGALSLVMEFKMGAEDPGRVPGRVFDCVRFADGVLEASKRLPGNAAEPSDSLIGEQQERLASLSRSELLSQIQAKNAELVRHHSELEQTVAARTAELHEASKEAERANRAKSAFLSNMSHELRTPLNGVLGYAQLMQRDAAPEQRERLTAISSCGEHLLALINDVLDFSKIEAGRMELEFAPCDLTGLLANVADIVRQRAESKGLEFSVTQRPGLPSAIEVDAAKVRQVLVNLLGNSVKFTPKGAVELIAEVVSPGWLNVEVRDTGMGISPERINEIFDPFKQAEAGQKSGGTGLGLAISRKLVETMGGELEVTSELGKGSSFTMRLPFQEADAAESAAVMQPDADLCVAPGQPPLEVVVADDIEANRGVLVGILAAAGMGAIEAENGAEALAVLREKKSRAVLMDLRMPVMDGLEATSLIREDDSLRETVVIAVTASAFDDERDRVMQSGFDDYVSKPVRAAEILRALARHLSLDLVEIETAAPAAAGAPGGDSLAALTGEHAREIAQRIRDCVASGNLAALRALGTELVEAGPPAAGAGERISELARGFQLDALGRLSDALLERAKEEA